MCLCAWKCVMRLVVIHTCACECIHMYLVTQAFKRALYFKVILFPPSATAAKAWDIDLASFNIGLTLPAASWKHTCRLMNCHITMTICIMCSHAGGNNYASTHGGSTAGARHGWLSVHADHLQGSLNIFQKKSMPCTATCTSPHAEQIQSTSEDDLIDSVR